MRMMKLAVLSLALGLSPIVAAEQTQPAAAPNTVASATAPAMPSTRPGPWSRGMRSPQGRWAPNQSWNRRAAMYPRSRPVPSTPTATAAAPAAVPASPAPVPTPAASATSPAEVTAMRQRIQSLEQRIEEMQAVLDQIMLYKEPIERLLELQNLALSNP